MQEWMIAMLVISIMLIIRDMAKTILAENLPDTEELPSLQEGHPQKERVEKYAASFQKLADTFYGMPYRKDYLSSRQVEQIIEDTNAKVCSRCYQREICWGEHSQELVKGVEALVRSMESGNEENVRGIRADWTGICPRSVQYYETVAENFQKERQNLMWDNRMIENRLAVAQQLMEVSHIMENVASDLYDLERVTPQFEEELRKGLRKSHVILRRAWMMNKVKGRKQIFLTMRARSGQCISMTEIAQLLSKYCEISMVPVTLKADEVRRMCESRLEDENGRIEILGIGDALFFPRESPLVNALYKAYTDVTGDTENKPMVIGGGTYAKSLKNIIAFGPEKPGIDYRIHSADEFILVSGMEEAVLVYMEAIKNLLAI